MNKKFDKSILSKNDQLKHVEIPETIQDQGLWHKLISYNFLYSVFGLLLGVIFVLVGSVLIFLGIKDDSSITLNILGIESTINGAMPGIILSLIGLITIAVTKFKVVLKKTDTASENKKKKSQKTA